MLSVHARACLCVHKCLCLSACRSRNSLQYDVLIDLCAFRFIFYKTVQNRCRILRERSNVVYEKNETKTNIHPTFGMGEKSTTQ